jgi:K+-transporting ATPase ATPase C chain
MLAHLRANLILLVLTLLLCSVVYPAILWAVGSVAFPDQAAGSLVLGPDGKTVVGSRLIAQPFTADEYFQPRPSAVNYDASASGGSNLAASNPKLRGRVAQALGPIVHYKEDGPRMGAAVGPDVEQWFASRDGLVALWAKKYPTLVGVWATADPVKSHILAWFKEGHPDAPEPKAEDVAADFLTEFAAKYPRQWPAVVDKKVQPVKDGSEIQSYFFDLWLGEHPEAVAAMEPVPADMVTTSGSGLDPHITLRNAEYQLKHRVAAARAKKSGRNEVDVYQDVKLLLSRNAFTPLGGLAGGEPLVNVLEINLLLDGRK